MDISNMRKKLIYKLWAALTLFALLASLSPARAQETPEATQTQPTPTAPSGSTNRRPIVVVQSYSTDVDSISPGSSFNTFIMLVNSGTSTATNWSFHSHPVTSPPRKPAVWSLWGRYIPITGLISSNP
jgi:hypothetical protein